MPNSNISPAVIRAAVDGSGTGDEKPSTEVLISKPISFIYCESLEIVKLNGFEQDLLFLTLQVTASIGAANKSDMLIEE